MAAAAQQGDIPAASNGSFCDGLGAAAWMIEGATVDHKISRESMVPGDLDNESMY